MNEFLQGLWASDTQALANPKQKISGQSIIVLTASELRKHEVTAQLEHKARQNPNPQHEIQVFNLKDFVAWLASKVIAPPFQLISDFVAQRQLLQIWEQQQDSCPVLKAEFEGLEDRGLFIADLYREFEEARLFARDFHDVFPIYAQHSQVEADRCHELKKLLETHEKQQKKQRQADFISTIRLLIQDFRGLERVVEESWLIFDQIFINSQLEEAFFGLIIESSEQNSWIEPSFLANPPTNAENQPSFDALYRTHDCLAQLSETQNKGRLQRVLLAQEPKNRRVLLSSLFDGQKMTAKAPILLENLEFWSCHNPRDEVKRCFAMIAAQKNPKNQAKTPQQQNIVVAVPDLQAYRGLFQEYARNYNFDCRFELEAPISQHSGLRHSLSALKLLENGNLEDFLVFFEGQKSIISGENHKNYQKNKEIIDFELSKTEILVNFGQYSALSHYFSQLNSTIDRENQQKVENYERNDQINDQINDQGDGAGQPKLELLEHFALPERHFFDPARLHCAMRRAQLPGGLDFEGDWLAPLTLAMRAWLEHEDLSWLFSVLCDLTYWAKIHKIFEEIRKKCEFSSFFQAFSEIFASESAKKTSFWAKMADLAKRPEKQGLSFESFGALAQFFRTQVRQYPQQCLHNPSADLTVVNWDRAIAYRPQKKLLIVLGLTASARPSYLAPVHHHGLIDSQFESFRYQRAAYFRRFLSLVLTQPAYTILSAPRILNNVEVPMQPALKTLIHWLKNKNIQIEYKIQHKIEGKIENENGADSAIKRPANGLERVYLTARDKAELGQFDDIDAALQAQVLAGRKALVSRYSSRFTPYDGNLAKVAAGLDHEGPNTYSPTVIEILADCPHRHFFKNMLYLPEFPEVREELPRHEVGTAVHECLELFWLSEKWTGGPITPANFGRACELMQEIANEVLAKSGVDWDRGPLRRFDKRAILRGLEDHEDKSRRGLLRAALAFQRDLAMISGPAFRTEYPFGMGGDSAVPVTDKVSVRGIIDRIDPIKDANGDLIGYLVLDYKTGSAKTISDVIHGYALQIAIYAYVVQDRFGFKDKDQPLFIRGGLLTLKEPNRRANQGVALDHPTRGVYREHLAVERKGMRWLNVDDIEVVEKRLEEARARIADLDSKVRHGELWQNISPKACAYCDYRNICQHDEKLVEQKQKSHLLQIHESNQDSLFDRLPIAVDDMAGKEAATAQNSAAQSAVENYERIHNLPPTSELESKSAADLEVTKPSLSEEQEQAACIDHSVSVSAGAGSGKTFILKTRVARLVRAGVPIQNILALTFTEMAAAEIQHRIEQSLGEALDQNELDGEELSDKERQLFIRARADIELASISTIHSLCQRLIQFDPVLAGVSGQLQIISGQELADIQRSVIRQVFADDSEVAEAIEELMEAGLTSYKIRGQIRMRLAAEDRVQQLLKSLGRSESEWRDLLPQILQDHCRWQIQGILAQLWDLFEEATKWTDTESALTYLKKNNRDAEFVRMLDHLEHVFDLVDDSQWSAAVERLQLCLEQMLAVDKEVKFRKSKALPVNYWKSVRDLIKALKLERVHNDFAPELESLRLGRLFLKVVVHAQGLYKEQKRQKNLIDFEELISRAHKMLMNKQPTAVLEDRQQLLIKRLRQRFQHLLVDEFQDTDQRQWQILQCFLNKEPGPQQALPSSMFIVGDPKQSIYGWRHSDNRVFAAAREHLKEHFAGQSVTLSDNYRSSSEVLKWVNVFFDRVFASEFKDDGEKWVDTAVEAQAMTVKNERVPGSVQVLWLPKRKRSAQFSLFESEASRDELQIVAELTESILLGDPRFPVSAHKGPRIGILCRTTRVLRAMGQALDSLNIPYSSTHRAGFFSQASILTIETALRALVYEKDDISLVGLLRSPIFGLSDVNLYQLRQVLRAHSRESHPNLNWTELLRRKSFQLTELQAENRAQLSDKLQQQVQRFQALYQSWREARYQQSCANFVRQIIADSGLDIAYSLAERQSAKHNLWRFIELVEEMEQDGLNDLVELLDWMNTQRLSAPEGAAMLPADDLPVVLTTIHGSKGLEFPIVILPDLGRRSQQRHDFIEVELPGEEQPTLGLRVLDEGQEQDFKRNGHLLTSVLARQNNSRNLSEEKRLFYVACTRAVNHLILPIQVGSTSGFEELPLVAKERQQKLRKATSHKALILANGRPDDFDLPNSIRFESEDDHVEVKVVTR